jgi:hypothetical protein
MAAIFTTVSHQMPHSGPQNPACQGKVRQGIPEIRPSTGAQANILQ